MTCARLLLDLLAAHGIDTAFGIPGVHTLELYRALNDSTIRHQTPRHEQGAGFMADGYARASGRPAACFIITGPGMTNIATAMGQALADSIPMLVISSVNRRATLGRGQGRLHEMPDQQATLSGVSVFSQTILDPSALPEAVARAFAIFHSARPGPVHLEVPLDVLAQPAPKARIQPARIYPPAPAPAAISQAIDWLVGAENPLVLLGGGCVDAPEAARALIERLDAPALTTINAKGILGRDHPLDLGATASLPASRELAARADVVLAVGTELGETDYDLVFDDGFALTGRLIRVDIDAQQLGRNQRADLAILADAANMLVALNENLPAGTIDKHGAARAANVRNALALHDQADVAPHLPLLQTLTETLPDAIIVGDSTGPAYAGNYWVSMPRPRHWFSAATGFGTLGYALPAALGAALARPDAQVVALVGDGGLQFTLAELGSARDLGRPIVVIVWNNNGYDEIRRSMAASDVNALGVDLIAPDISALAQAFALDYRRCERPTQLAEALSQADEATRPVLIEIPTQPWMHNTGHA
ncbi:5-guanidino-2-oxopentanoate decarboxylase [Saccharospirillum sp.]|uniref:5-guanidino-2-oxopentanoate decarboxylase n=1 Tax=Saccharospirillum sp. TaxID=2033801 RepID=UPI0034A037D3